MNIKKKQRVNTTSDYALFKKTYSNSREFKDKDKQSGNIRDLIDKLENKGISYEIYDNKTNNGCTIFYDDDGTITAASYGGAFDIEDDPAEFNSVEDYLKYNIEEGYIDWLSLPSEENDDFDDDDFDDDDFYDIVYQIESAIAKVTRGWIQNMCTQPV